MSFSSDGVKLHAQPKRNRAFLLSVRATEFILSVLFVIALAGWALVPEATQATAGVAKVLSYQGRLTDASGNPLGGSGTNYYLCFSIWDVSTGGTRNPNQLWPASYAVPTSMTVNVANGVFTADIGSGTDDLSTFNFYDNDTVYLNVEAASSNGTCGGSPFETLSPRQRIAATAYARVTRDVYGNLLRTDNANNKVQIGDPGGAPTTPIFLNLGVKTSTADGLLSWVGQSCSVNGALWYNSGLATPRVLLCENNLVKALSNATTTIDALSVTAANGNATFASGTVNFAAGNNITLSSGAQAITIHGAAGGAGLGGIAASNTTYTSGTILFTGSNNITISSSGAGQTVIVSGPNVHNVSLSGNNTAGVMAQISTGTMYLAGGNNIILSQNGNSVTISASSQSVQPVAISGSNGSFAFSTLTMGNLNGLSFYTSNGSLVGSYTAGGGAGVTLSQWEPYLLATSTAVSSLAPASIWFNTINLPDAVAISKVNLVKSFNFGVPTATSTASSGTNGWSYSQGFSIFTRQDYGANSTNLSYLTSGSAGLTYQLSWTSVNESLSVSWVTNSTGGTSSWSTASGGNSYSSYWTGLKYFRIPLVTTLTAGEYWIGHRQSSTSASVGNSNITIGSLSNLQVTFPAMSLGNFGSAGSIAGWAPGKQGVGFASAFTTNNTMAMSVISATSQQFPYFNFVNF